MKKKKQIYYERLINIYLLATEAIGNPKFYKPGGDSKNNQFIEFMAEINELIKIPFTYSNDIVLPNHILCGKHLKMRFNWLIRRFTIVFLCSKSSMFAYL